MNQSTFEKESYLKDLVVKLLEDRIFLIMIY